MNWAIIEPVPPWRRVPQNWVCAECHRPAAGVMSLPGLVVFYCAEHNDALGDWVMDTLDYGSAPGYYRLRYDWGPTLRNYAWRATHVWKLWKRRRSERGDEEKLDAIFGPYEYDPAKALIARTTA